MATGYDIRRFTLEDPQHLQRTCCCNPRNLSSRGSYTPADSPVNRDQALRHESRKWRNPQTIQAVAALITAVTGHLTALFVLLDKLN
jgi:hypothetical protein